MYKQNASVSRGSCREKKSSCYSVEGDGSPLVVQYL